MPEDLDEEDVQMILANVDADTAILGHTLLWELHEWAWQEFVIKKRPRVINTAGQPVYRGDGGCCCPLGHAISRHIQLDPWENMMSISKLIYRRPDIFEVFKGVRPGVWNDLQNCHDCGQFGLMPERLLPQHVALGLLEFKEKHKPKKT